MRDGMTKRVKEARKERRVSVEKEERKRKDIIEEGQKKGGWKKTELVEEGRKQ